MSNPIDRFRWRPGDVRPLVSLYLEPEQARVLKSILDDASDAMDGVDEEAGRIALAREVAAAIDRRLAKLR